MPDIVKICGQRADPKENGFHRDLSSFGDDLNLSLKGGILS
jgi:hypothetical protein